MSEANAHAQAAPVLPTPAEIESYLNQHVHGQHRVKRALALAIYNHYLSHGLQDVEGESFGRHHVLLYGPTGSGKTFIIRLLESWLEVPMIRVSATSLVEAGYRGRSPDDLINALLLKAGGDARHTEKGIILLDEVDKIRKEEVGGQRDVSGEEVQNALLTILDGKIADNVDGTRHHPVNTGRVLFICTGAFTGLERIVQRRLRRGQAPLGFSDGPSNETVTPARRAASGYLQQAQTEDFLEFGMVPEFIGRFATLAALEELSAADLKAIATNPSRTGPLRRHKRLAQAHGVDLHVTDEALEAIASEALDLGIGARGLDRALARVISSLDQPWNELADEGIRRVVIHRGCVTSGSAPHREAGAPLIQRVDTEVRQTCLDAHAKTEADLARQSHGSAPAGPLAFTDTRGWTEERIERQIEIQKVRCLGWRQTPATARFWWLSLEHYFEHQSALILRFVEELRNRKSTIYEAYLAYTEASTYDLYALLLYIDFARAKRQAEQRKPESAPQDPLDDTSDEPL